MKNLFGSVFIDKEELIKKQNEHVKLEYYKIKDNEEENYVNYGIEVLKKTGNEDVIDVEGKYIKNVSSSEKVVDNILEKLKRNTVTPTTLTEVTQELMKENEIY